MAPNSHRGGRGITLDITAEVIEVAKVRDSGHCVIADALRAAVPEASFVSVDLQTIRWTNREAGRRYIYLTPAPAQHVLVEFDQGIEPEPFRLQLGKPAQIHKTNRGSAARREKAATADLPEGLGKQVGKPRGNGTRPTVMGGAPPPSAALSNRTGKRREFGLRTLKR